MNIDERIQAIAESLELLASMHRDHEKRYAEDSERVSRGIQAFSQGLQEVMVLHRENETRIAQLMDTMNRLGRILEIHDSAIDNHEDRLGKLERPR